MSARFLKLHSALTYSVFWVSGMFSISTGLPVLALTMTIDFCHLPTFTPTKPKFFCNKPNPAKSPSFMFEASNKVEPVDSGPMVRWVSVLRASTNELSIRPVFKRKKPFRSDTDQSELSGLWFHCQPTARPRRLFCG